jgi:hypothetical protein
MRKYYRAIDTRPFGEDNITALLKLNAVHYSTSTSERGVYRNFVMHLDEDELLIAKLSLHDVSINPLSESDFNFLKSSGYIK